MKRVQYNDYGGPEAMSLENFELETPGKGQIAVKVKVAAINPIDWKVRSGHLKMVTGKTFPRAMGSDFSGTVLSVGPGVTRFKPGDAVFGMARLKESGAFSNALVTNETFAAHKPEEITFESAACLATAGVTAWNGLVDKAHLKAGQDVFVNGCTGAVGAMAVQIARALAASVSGSCSAQSMARARTLGLQEVFDYRRTDLSMLDGRFDVVYDTAAAMKTDAAFGLLRAKGVFLDINPTPAKFIWSLVSRKLKPIVCSPRADILDGIARMAAKGELRLPVGEVVPLSEAIRLVAALETGYKIDGKGLIAMD